MTTDMVAEMRACYDQKLPNGATNSSADPAKWRQSTLPSRAYRTGGRTAIRTSQPMSCKRSSGCGVADLYEPQLNQVYAALLAHYSAVADPARVADPNRKGSAESTIQHTQSTARKDRKFESIEEQNTWLAHWEERWAAFRIHGREKRQILQMYLEERAHLKPLPI